MVRLIAPLLMTCTLALSACAPGTMTDPDRTDRALPTDTIALPPMRTFAAHRPEPTRKSNAAIAQDFLALSFQLESGRELPTLTRFEGPVTVRVTGNAPASLAPDLAKLLARLRAEAGIDIRQVPASSPANITIEAVAPGQLQRLVPQAACFVAPRISSWSEYRRNRRAASLDWRTLEQREQLAIFLPSDVAPQEIRDCLHEELAQALGPLNDLYQLTDSVFNDDNFHTVLTGFDMLILRAYYAPELRSGMTREQVAARLPGILARINPSGNSRGTAPMSATPRVWVDAIESALGARGNTDRRFEAARTAVQIAQERGWRDNRAAFSLFVLGRLAMGSEADLALAAFLQADQIYSASADTQLQAAHVSMQLAAYALSSGQADTALNLVNSALPVVSASQNAALLSTLLMVKAEALGLMNRAGEAQSVRLEALGWARYGFGSPRDVRARMAEIAALTPRRTMEGPTG